MAKKLANYPKLSIWAIMKFTIKCSIEKSVAASKYCKISWRLATVGTNAMFRELMDWLKGLLKFQRNILLYL